MIQLSVVAPVFNEAGVLRELAGRCVGAAEQCDVVFEVLLIDDASTDGTQKLCASLPKGVVVHRLLSNQGQFRAIQEGLRRARGEAIAVLDGDLQDPPEAISALWRQLADTDSEVVFAVKHSRNDTWWFSLGNLGYRWALRVGGASVPSGAGTFCIMRRRVAKQVGEVSLERVNLSALLSAFKLNYSTIPYDKAARYDGQSRIGLLGLIREALSSLAVTGAISRWSALTALTSLVVAISGWLGNPLGWIAVAAVAMVVAIWVDIRVGRHITPARRGLHE